MQQAKPTMGCVMPSTAIPGAPASASIAQGTTWGRLLLPWAPTAGAPAQPLGLQQPLYQPRARKEWCLPPQEPPAGVQASSRGAWQRRKVRQGSLAPQVSCCCSSPVPRLLCTAQPHALISAGLGWHCLPSSASQQTLPSEAEQEALGDHSELPAAEKLQSWSSYSGFDFFKRSLHH